MDHKNKARLKNISAIVLMLVLTIIASNSVNAVEVIYSDPAPVRAGRYADITLQITIPDTFENARENVVYRIRETDDVRPVSGHEFRLSRVNPGQVFTRTFRVYLSENINTGYYPLELIENRDGQESRRSFDIFVEGRPDVPELKIGSARSTPSRLIRDTNDNILRVDLMNLGELDAELLTAELVADDSIEETFYGSLEDSLSSVLGGGSETLEFEFDIEDTNETRIDSYLDLSYRVDIDNRYEIMEVQLPLEIRLGRTPRFEITSLESVNGIAVDSSDREIRVTIDNVGEEDGENVRFRLYPNPEAPFDFERTTIFVTSLIEPGESTSFIVPFDVLDDALVQEYSINAEFESVIGANRYKQKDRLDISVTSEAAPPIATYALFALIASLGVALIIGFTRKKSKKR